MSHLDEGTLHALLDGEIPSHEIGPIQAHLAGCSACRARFEEERSLATEAMGLVEMVAVPEPALAAARERPLPRRSWTRGLAWAASVIGAVGLGYAARSATLPQVVRTDQAPSTAPEQKVIAQAPSESAATDQARVSPVAPRPQDSPPSSQPAGNTSQTLNPAPLRDEMRSEAAKAAPAAPAAPLAAAEQSAGGLAARENETRAQVGRQSLAQLKMATDSVEPVSFPEALRRLNGSIRLIPGLIPLGIEAQGPVVTVIYPGRILLRQQLVGGQVVYRLEGPAELPADSLERLRARVRE